MNKSPIDEMNENEYPDLEENRREGLEMLNRVEKNLADLNALEEEPTETTSSSSSEKQTEQPPEQKKPEEPDYSSDPNVEYIDGKPFYTKEASRQALRENIAGADTRVRERMSAPGQGVLDTGLGAVNTVLRTLKIPEIPKFSKYETQEAQVTRDISSVVLPAILLGRAGTSKLTGIHTKYGSNLGKLGQLGNNAAFARFAKYGVAAGSGAIVDYNAPISSEDDNIAATFRDTWPQTWGWINPDWATNDEDTPDIKRQKNMKEGVLLSVGADLIVGAAKLLQKGGKLLAGRHQIRNLLTWVPENEKAIQTVKKLNDAKKATTPEEVVEETAKKQNEAIDEIGEYNLTKSVDLDQPIFGVTDVYDDLDYAFRTADPGGVYSMAVDTLRIEKNIDTVYGRIGSGFTPSALKFATDADEGAEVLVQGMTAQLRDGGKYGYNTSNGRYLSWEEINGAGDRLAADLMNMDVKSMKAAFADLTFRHGDHNVDVLKEEAYNGVFKAINKYLKEYATLDHTKAYSYLSTSVAGQVSDMAEGLRLMDGTAAVEHAQAEILDRLQFLMAAKGQRSYIDGLALNRKNLWRKTKSFTGDKLNQLRGMAEADADEIPRKLREKAEEAKQTVETLRAVNKERPEMLGPLMLAYELTDGKVHSMHKLNNYINNSTGMFSKLLIDTQSDIPSTWVQGVWANIYNSVLSSVVTPMKALASNSAILIERPISTFIGAAINRDTKTIRRGIYQYRAIVDTFTKGWGHMNEVYKRAAKDPSSVGYIMRDDIARKNEQQLEILRAYADAQSELGNDGPAAMLAQVEELNALADHPWLRYGPNAMSGLDGFTRAVVANIEARGRAFDAINTSGGRLSQDMMDDIAKQQYNQMFDKNDIITDQAVEYASREIAMNLDSDFSSSLGELLADAPMFKPFIMFPRTSMNMALFAASHSPLGLMPRYGPAKQFQDTVHKFSRPIEEMAREEVSDLLTSRGLEFTDETMELVYNNIRAEMKGRKALGAIAVLAGSGMFLAGNLRGDGHFDKETQRTRREADWKPRTFKGWDGRWYSYDNLGPMSDWIAAAATVSDNIVDGTLTPTTGTELFNKLGFILSSSITSKSVMSGLEPMNDIFAGNPAAFNRWAASFGSGMAPLSGLRNDLSRVMTPQLKIFDQELLSLIMNRNPLAKGELPDQYDYIDGGLIGVPSDPITRMWNALTPFKVSDKISDEKQFLIDIEFDGKAQLATNGKGVKLTPEEQSAISQKMGEQKYFRDAIRKVMRSGDGKAFREAFKKARSAQNDVDVSEWQNVHIELKMALSKAVNAAIDDLEPDMKQQIREAEWRQNESRRASRLGDIEALQKHSTTRYR